MGRNAKCGGKIVDSPEKQAEAIFDNYLSGLEPIEPENHHLIVVGKQQIKSLLAETIGNARKEILDLVKDLFVIEEIEMRYSEDRSYYTKGFVNKELFVLLLYIHFGAEIKETDVKHEYLRCRPDRANHYAYIVENVNGPGRGAFKATSVYLE